MHQVVAAANLGPRPVDEQHPGQAGAFAWQPRCGFHAAHFPFFQRDRWEIPLTILIALQQNPDKGFKVVRIAVLDVDDSAVIVGNQRVFHDQAAQGIHRYAMQAGICPVRYNARLARRL